MLWNPKSTSLSLKQIEPLQQCSCFRWGIQSVLLLGQENADSPWKAYGIHKQRGWNKPSSTWMKPCQSFLTHLVDAGCEYLTSWPAACYLYEETWKSRSSVVLLNHPNRPCRELGGVMRCSTTTNEGSICFEKLKHYVNDPESLCKEQTIIQRLC